MIRYLSALIFMLSIPSFADDNELPYILMQDDLAPLKRDFNEAVDQLRLVFVVGPT